MPAPRRLRAVAAAAAVMLLALASGPATGHDTWLAPRADTERGERVLALSTGEQFPRPQTAIPVELLQRAGCVAPANQPGPRQWPLRWWADSAEALLLRSTRPVPTARLLDCAVATAPQAIRLDSAAAAAYLDELRADGATRERWRALQAAGQAWTENYAKHTRLLHGAALIDQPFEAGAPTAAEAMPLDLRLVLPRWPLRVGDAVQLQLLRDGQPLAGHAVELRNDLSPIGLWRRTDGEGRLVLPLPLAANWLVRSVWLMPRDGAGPAWDSRFLAVGFEVLAPR